MQARSTRTLAKLGKFLLMAGLLALAAGIFCFFRAKGYDPSAAPDCGGKVMSRGEVCLDWDGDGAGTFEEMQASAAANHNVDTWIRNIGLAGGPLLMILGVVLLVRALRAYVDEYEKVDGPVAAPGRTEGTAPMAQG